MEKSALFLTVAVFLYVALANANPSDLLGDVTISATVSYDQNSAIYTYGYINSNPSASSEGIAQIEIDVTRPAGSASVDTIGLAYADSATAVIVKRAYQFRYGTVTSVSFSSLPSYWRANLSNHRTAAWFTSRSHLIEPNASLSGFGLQSKGIPSIRDVKISPYLNVEQFPSVDSMASLEAADSLVAYIDSLRAVSPKKLRTIGPTNPPGTFIALDFLDTLIAMKNEAKSLNWIQESNLSDLIDTRLSKARDHLESEDESGALEDLQAALSAVEEDCLGVGPGPGVSYLTTEGCALLRYNIQYLMEQLE